MRSIPLLSCELTIQSDYGEELKTQLNQLRIPLDHAAKKHEQKLSKYGTFRLNVLQGFIKTYLLLHSTANERSESEKSGLF